ncbi:hypothetical protein CEE37_04615 [candidate division LCP-89 bacterium B3_LCP]|uniref:Fis family transcriptional regulator n=1 Tax=candidate division LCP-89 bacterium B3_LCP TaxID=2012998 RepID=A0A532V3U1_UNCL8|nr:MAG: hypothetical protein CEE37_04615 [candidate division LCP-89 bacterium B3_LCP]
MKERILIVDDERSSRELCQHALEKPHREIVLCTNAEEALEAIGKSSFDVVLTDMVMPGLSGLELLEQIKSIRSDTSVLLMSGKGSISAAVRAIQSGAEDFIEKPFHDPEIVNIAVSRILTNRHLLRENRELRSELKKLKEEPVLIGGKAFSKVLQLAERVAPIDTTVLITGETGTGKEVLAKRIHFLSKGTKKPFTAINCGGIPPNLLESLLFGHEKGAFTGAIKRIKGYFERAGGGTIFLDEIGDMPPDLQVKLLRVLQDKTIRRIGGEKDLEVKCRVMAATHQDLKAMVDSGSFREDLYYRLNVIRIHIPPLRERGDDVETLAKYFNRISSARMNIPVKELSSSSMELLNSHDWPGNIRELQNVIERTVALCSGDSIMPDDLPAIIREGKHRRKSDIRIQEYNQAKIEFERDFIESALKMNDYNVSAAAKAVGIPRQNFYLKMNKLGIKPQEVLQPV